MVISDCGNSYQRLRTTTNKIARLCKLIPYLRSWLSQLVRVHLVVAAHKVAVCEIEELADSTVNLRLIQLILVHPGRGLASLVHISRVDPPLAWLHLPAKKIADYARSIQTRPLDQVHQFLDLPGVL